MKTADFPPLVETDPHSGATYLVFASRPVHRTLNLSDLVMVDLDLSGQVVGVEFAANPTDIKVADRQALAEDYPDAWRWVNSLFL